MAQKTVKVSSKNGIHMRPGLKIVDEAHEFESNITIETSSGTADAKSIMQVTMLGIEDGSEVIIIAEGCDAQEAVDAVAGIVEMDFEKDLVEGV